MEQLEQNLAAVEVELDAEDIAKLDEVSALPSEYPGWMLERQGARPASAAFRAESLIPEEARSLRRNVRHVA